MFQNFFIYDSFNDVKFSVNSQSGKVEIQTAVNLIKIWFVKNKNLEIVDDFEVFGSPRVTQFELFSQNRWYIKRF